MTENNEILQLPSWDDIPSLKETGDGSDFLKGDDWFGMDVTKDFLDFTEPYKPPRWTLMRKGVKFADMGELHVISGKPGNGKTNLMAQIVATILCGKFGKTEYTKPDNVTNPVVLFIDTEMGKDDTIALKNRICTMANLDYTKQVENLYILRLRDTEKAELRWKKILKAIWLVKPTDIFLDGALDIVNDYNDQAECKPIIDKAMKTAEHYDSSLWIVHHENPLVDKMVGTLGSILQRKVSEVFSVIKHKQDDEKQRVPNFPDIYFEVKQLKSRGRDVDKWFFEIVPGANGWGMPVELDELFAQPHNIEEAKIQQERIEADDYLKHLNWKRGGVSYMDIQKYLESKGITSNRKFEKIIDTALQNGIIYKTDKKYFYNGLKNEVQNDSPEDLPFSRQNDNEVPY